ncbi:hypothetical protein ES703_93911 [subsurface metagenome]
MKQGIFELSSTPIYPIAKRYAVDERVFRYGKVGATALMGGRAAANLSTGAEITTATVASAIGAMTATITVVAAAGLVANELQGGYLCYKKTRYYRHRIKSHPAAENGATCVLTLETAIVGHAIAIGDTLIAYHSPWASVGYGDNGVYFSAIGFVGWPFGDIATDQYTWLQTWGPVNGTPTEFFGGIANQRQVWFASDGSLVTLKTGADPFSYQHAGFWVPNTYWGAALHAMEDGGHLLFLQIAP